MLNQTTYHLFSMGPLVRVEVDEIENIQKEVENNAIDLESVSER